MRKYLVLAWLVLCCTIAFAAAQTIVTKAFTDSKGQLHIVTSDWQDHLIRPEEWQAGGGFDSIDIAPDRRTVGWLVLQQLSPLEGGTNYSYSVAADLDVWRDGQVIRRIPSPFGGIKDWVFWKGGSEIALYGAPTHGPDFFFSQLIDVRTGKELAHWSIDRRDYVVPAWAKALLENETLPSPDDLTPWFPENERKAPDKEGHSPHAR
ncbi:MAG: hypothetical protein KGM96_09395 [Acidobacteriota bacterium]|nr:hypothetical protein [Acidobacteriota bacterium]